MDRSHTSCMLLVHLFCFWGSGWFVFIQLLVCDIIVSVYFTIFSQGWTYAVGFFLSNLYIFTDLQFPYWKECLYWTLPYIIHSIYGLYKFWISTCMCVAFYHEWLATVVWSRCTMCAIIILILYFLYAIPFFVHVPFIYRVADSVAIQF